MKLVCNSRLKNIIALYCIFLLNGCNSGSGDNEQIPAEPPSIANRLNFKAQPDFDDNLIATLDNIDKSLNSSINNIVTLPNNEILLIGQYATSDEYKDTKGFLARLTAQLELQQVVVDDGGFGGVCAHSSGKFSVAKFVKDQDNPDEDQYWVQIENYDDNGSLMTKTFLTDPFAENYYEIPFTQKEHDEYWYKIVNNTRTADPEHKVTFSNLVTYTSRSNFLRLHCDNEELLISYNYEGLKLTRYDQDLTQRWSQVISAQNFINSAYFGLAYTAVDSQGNIFVAASLTNNSVAAHNHRFSASLEYNSEKLTEANIIIRAYTPDGVPIIDKVIGSDESDSIADIEIINDTLLVGVNNRRLKSPEASNNTTEWDIGLFEVNLTDFSFNHHFLNFDNEDLLRGITRLGNDVYLFGVTGFNQVDTNSWVTNGKGFYKKLAYGSSQDWHSYIEIPGVRHSEIIDLTVVNNQLMAVGQSDAPITHSSDRNSSALLHVKNF